MDIDKKRYLGLSTSDRAHRIQSLTRAFTEESRMYAFAEPPYSARTAANIAHADNEIARMKKELTDEMNSFCEEIEELRKLTLRDAPRTGDTAHTGMQGEPGSDSADQQP